jgi:hypothetical protein
MEVARGRPDLRTPDRPGSPTFIRSSATTEEKEAEVPQEKPRKIDELRRILTAYLPLRLRVSMAHGIGADAETIDWEGSRILGFEEVEPVEGDEVGPGLMVRLDNGRLKFFERDLERLEECEEGGSLRVDGAGYIVWIDDAAAYPLRS